MEISNLFAAIPEDLPHELIERIGGSGSVRIGRIVSRGHASDPEFWYDQDTTEFVLLLQGQARLCFQDQAEPVALNPGDYLTIAAHCKHRVQWTTPQTDTLWLTVHF
jgi:cupin 2 domain-containing protein